MFYVFILYHPELSPDDIAKVNSRTILHKRARGIH